jgi:hypothetical protein
MTGVPVPGSQSMLQKAARNELRVRPATRCRCSGASRGSHKMVAFSRLIWPSGRTHSLWQFSCPALNDDERSFAHGYAESGRHRSSTTSSTCPRSRLQTWILFIIASMAVRMLTSTPNNSFPKKASQPQLRVLAKTDGDPRILQVQVAARWTIRNAARKSEPQLASTRLASHWGGRRGVAARSNTCVWYDRGSLYIH